MMNKIYEWIETSFASFRNDVPATQPPDNPNAPEDLRMGRKRPFECLEDANSNKDHDGLVMKKSRMGDFIDTVKIAAEGVKSHSSSVATWMKNMSPTLKNILPTTSVPPTRQAVSRPSTSSVSWARRPGFENSVLEKPFAEPSTTLEWKSSKSELFKNEKAYSGIKVCRRQVSMSPSHRETPKTNGHSVNTVPCKTAKLHSTPRLGRPLNLRPQGPMNGVSTQSPCTTMYEKTFPIKVIQSPTNSTSSGRIQRPKLHSTAQESICEDEKEIYRQLLSIVSGGQSSFLHSGNSHAIVRSHRDFTSFLMSSRRLLQCSSSPVSVEGETSEGFSGSPSLRDVPSQSSSNLHSPVDVCKMANQTWGLDTDITFTKSYLPTSPSPSVLQDGTSQDTKSSAQDGDSVIIVKEQKPKPQDHARLPCFQAELWIKELTSMYDSRARERRRQIEEQEALAAQLLRQRLSEEVLHSPHVEVHIRVPLEKEVPLAPVAEEPKPLEEKPEFPELTDEMEVEINRVLRGSNPHEVLSEGFGLSLTRKDLQTLSNLNWLNDEVINFYMNLLVERSKNPNLPSVNTFNTFFFPKLRSSGYSAVRRWTKKMDIFSRDILLVPVHLGVHWCLSVVDFRKKAVLYFDSMGGNNDEACSILFEYLQLESKDKRERKWIPRAGVCTAKNAMRFHSR
uniref:Si:dkey-21c19.3 n=1 Tax=Neogobius melanostomus TaxID=47308 RepID=A0A8C6WMM2_9GOBI